LMGFSAALHSWRRKVAWGKSQARKLSKKV
jgi:hypothetical protein